MRWASASRRYRAVSATWRKRYWLLAKEAGPLAMRCTIASQMLAQVQGLNERIQRLA
ncbi:hypothetical protein JK621_02015 [Serratia plymuthica]|uniref:hypothetical protein n=1 Tax=Serratia plymuthica TaxID=82996 RepID=UPI001BAEDFB3|nr:hypothetical protein [Serratia plymuthica]QUY48993.1 hypothetical protein JK621_02015 [Serratia plymuthica]